jgi:hypothetical protein
MTCLVQKLGRLAILGSAVIVLLGKPLPTAAEINLNPWFYPNWKSGHPAAATNPDDPPPQMSDAGYDNTAPNAQPARRPAKVAMSQAPTGKQTVYDGSATSNDQANAPTDQPGSPGYQSTGTRNGSNTGSQVQGRPRMSTQPAYSRPASVTTASASTQPPPSQNGYGRVYGLQASRMQVGNSQSVMAPGNAPPGSAMPSGVMPGSSAPGMMSSPMVAPNSKYMSAPPPGGVRTPVVGPNGVYIDGETIGPGAPRAGSVYDGEMMGPGPTMMDHGGDGFANPYCNDCCGGPGGNCNSCNSGWGRWGNWFGGNQCGNTCNDESCDDSCGPDCEGHNPYGRPWILAPFDLFCGELSSSCHGWWWGENLSVFVGTENFRSTVNIDGVSNFGFNEGFNWSMPVSRTFGWAFQVGADFTQTGFDSTPATDLDQTRFQTFLTLGLFHRPTCQSGLQYGLAFDWLHDEFYDKFDVTQLRGEISWMVEPNNDYGFWFSAGVKDDTVHNQMVSPVTFEVVDQFAFFHRRRFCRGGDARFWIGGTDNKSVLLGADFCVPVAQSWGLEGGFNYLISGNRDQTLADESWNIGVNVVFYLGGNAFCQSPSRPLFNVADNSSLVVRAKGAQ